MPALTVKNIPESLYNQLKTNAAAHHRSLNGEIIHCLEQAVSPNRESPQEYLQRARALRQGIAIVDPAEIQRMIREGRD